MEQLKRGSKAPRVSATCSRCGSTFERSAVHPYIVECPECRESARLAVRAAREADRHCRCKACREPISSPARLGMHRCSGRESHLWWSIGDGRWRNLDTDDVFGPAGYQGSLRDGDFDAVMSGAAHA